MSPLDNARRFEAEALLRLFAWLMGHHKRSVSIRTVEDRGLSFVVVELVDEHTGVLYGPLCTRPNIGRALLMTTAILDALRCAEWVETDPGLAVADYQVLFEHQGVRVIDVVHWSGGAWFWQERFGRYVRTWHDIRAYKILGHRPASNGVIDMKAKTVGEIITTARKGQQAAGAVRTIAVDVEKLDRAVGAAAKPLLDFLEALADVVSPSQPASEVDADQGEQPATAPETEE